MTATRQKTRATNQWRSMDLHLHTPASGDYQQPDVSYMQLLQRAEARGLDMIAFTDHNTVAGYRLMRGEIEQLEWLERINRLLPDELSRLKEYRRLLNKVLVFPGFEFTATFGFHILGIFSPNKPVREIEHLLLTMNIPPDKLDEGSPLVGATVDVLTAYRVIHDAGGLVIAAHANSSNGVAMRGFNFGGQTKIAYTQDFLLHALEVTDLELRGPRTTAAFFNGAKPEYQRRMHCIQGSDAHRLTSDAQQQRKRNYGVGDRATDVLLPEVSFEALKELFESNDFARTRPHRQQAEPVYDFIKTVLEEGESIVQSFHDNANVRGGKLNDIICDICAFANINGGALYVGIGGDNRKTVVGLPNPALVMEQLEKEINTRISPPLPCTLDVHETGGKKILRVLVARGGDPPYVVDDNKVYVRSEAETELAVRDEIVSLVLRGQSIASRSSVEIVRPLIAAPILPVEAPPAAPVRSQSGEYEPPVLEDAPHTGVEVVAVHERDGVRYYTVRDLRNGNVVKNVTRGSARRLWQYAINEFARLPADPTQAAVNWEGDLGLLKRYKQGQLSRYDMVQRLPGGSRVFFGVTDDGIHGRWKALIGVEEDAA